MICLGNICRSPIAEAVMIDVVKKQNLSEKIIEIDSAAIGESNYSTFMIAARINTFIRFMACRKKS